MEPPIEFERNKNSKLSHPNSVLPKKLILEVNKRLLSETSYQRLLDFIFDSLDQALPCDRIGVALVEGEDAEAQLSLKWLRSKAPVNHLNLCYSAKIEGSSLQNILQTGQPRIISDLAEYIVSHPQSQSSQLIVKDGIRSSLTCPLRAGNRKIGVVFFSSFQPHTYQECHVQTFLEIADELAMIVDHMRLRRELHVYKSKTRNLNMTIHDLKSPLTAIKGFAEMSLDEPWYQKLPSEGRHVFDVFLRNSNAMFELLNDLLEIAELDRAAEVFISEEVKLKSFFSECCVVGMDLSKTKEIEFNAETSLDASLVARFDRRQILRVVNNLFSNAVKYSQKSGKIFFSTNCDSESLIFSVRDLGPGIPQSELPKLFREFGKTSVRPTNGESSTGLGLAIAKKIVEQHEGSISVSSEVGEGSTFTFSIPLSGVRV